jgi:hypothetical protein
MDYQAEYGLSEDDIKFIDEKIQEANNIFAEISKKKQILLIVDYTHSKALVVKYTVKH